jgi:hypothetical protein
MLPLLLLLLDRQVAPDVLKEEPPAQAGGFSFRTAMLRNRFPEIRSLLDQEFQNLGERSADDIVEGTIEFLRTRTAPPASAQA